MPLRLIRRPDGAYARKSAQGEEVLVSKKPDGSWDIYQNGSSEALGIWRRPADSPQKETLGFWKDGPTISEEPPEEQLIADGRSLQDLPKPKKVKRGGLLGWLGFEKTVYESGPNGKIEPHEVRELFFLENDVQGKEIYRDVKLPKPPKAKPWRAKHYDVSLKIGPDGSTVSGRSLIHGYGTRPSGEIPLDLGHFPGDLEVTDRSGMKPLFAWNDEGVKVRQTISPGEEFSLEVKYSGKPQPVSHPGVPSDLGWLSSDSSLVTFNGAAPSSSWLPGDDNPANKATYDFQIQVPEHHFAVANGKLMEEKVLPNGEKLFHYRSRFPMASYLASVNTFDERQFARTEVAPEFEVVHPRGMESQVHSEFKNHRRMMGFLEKRLGKYPFETYGAIVTNLPVDSYKTRFTDGENTYEADSVFEIAFEAQTRPIFQADSITGKGDFEPTIIHEMAHQWYGNAVTNASQDDVWVNEAFPSYSGWLWMEEEKGSEVFEAEMRGLYDSVKNHKFGDTMARPNRDKLFSQENYARMTLSMHALRRKLGDEQFYSTLKGAVEAHKYESVSVDELAHTMNQLNGGRLSGFFQRWLHEKELPPYPESRTNRTGWS